MHPCFSDWPACACHQFAAHRRRESDPHRDRPGSHPIRSGRRMHLSHRNCILTVSWKGNAPPVQPGKIFNVERKRIRSELPQLGCEPQIGRDANQTPLDFSLNARPGLRSCRMNALHSAPHFKGLLFRNLSCHTNGIGVAHEKLVKDQRGSAPTVEDPNFVVFHLPPSKNE